MTNKQFILWVHDRLSSVYGENENTDYMRRLRCIAIHCQKQSKKGSLLEVLCSTATGFIVSMVITYYLLPWFPSTPSVFQAFQITAIYTVVSIIRAYVWRRLFNR